MDATISDINEPFHLQEIDRGLVGEHEESQDNDDVTADHQGCRESDDNIHDGIEDNGGGGGGGDGGDDQGPQNATPAHKRTASSLTFTPMATPDQLFQPLARTIISRTRAKGVTRSKPSPNSPNQCWELKHTMGTCDLPMWFHQQTIDFARSSGFKLIHPEYTSVEYLHEYVEGGLDAVPWKIQMDASEDSPLSSLPPTDILIRAYWHCLGTTSNCTRQGKCKMKLKAEVRKDDPTFLYLYAGNSHEGETEPRILPWSRLLKEQARVHCIKYAGTTRSFMLHLESQIEKGVLPPVHRIPTRDQVNGVRMRARVKQEPVHPED